MKTWNKNIRFQHVSTAWAILGPSSITWSTIPVSCTHLLACPVAMSLVRLQPVAAHKFGDSFEPCKLMRQTVSKFVSRFRYRWYRYHRNAKAQRKHMIYGNMKTEVDWSWLKLTEVDWSSEAMRRTMAPVSVLTRVYRCWTPTWGSLQKPLWCGLHGHAAWGPLYDFRGILLAKIVLTKYATVRQSANAAFCVKVNVVWLCTLSDFAHPPP